MSRPFLSLLITVPVVLAVGCAKPDLDFQKIRVGMTKKDIVARVGEPTRTSVVKGADVYEYEAFDRYGALKVNQRSQFIRFVDGKVDAFGNLEDLASAKPPASTPGAVGKAGLVDSPTPERPKATTPAPAAFDLRTELEKLEKLKTDGLISEAEFRELRQKVIDKAKAQ